MKRWSIGKKILCMVLTVALAGIGISIVLSISNMWTIRNISVNSSEVLGITAAEKSKEALVAQMEKNLQDLVVHKASENADVVLEHYLDDTKQCAEYVTWLYEEYGIGLEGGAEEKSVLDKLHPVFSPIFDGNQDMIARIYLASEQGFMLSYDGRMEIIDAEEYDCRKSGWYQTARDQKIPMFAEAYFDSLGERLMTTCSASYYNADGRFAGVVCMDMPLERFYQEILNVDISDHADAALVDGKGNLIAGPKVDFGAADIRTVWDLETAKEYDDLIGHILAGENGVGQANEMYFAYAPIRLLDWRLIIRVPRADIISPVNHMNQAIQEDTRGAGEQIERSIMSSIAEQMLLLAVVIVAVIIMAVRLTGRIVRPLKSLQEQVGIIQKGNLNARVWVSSEDEIGGLAREFNAMTASLKEQMEEIQKVTAEKERIGAELSVAAQIQASMLPKNFDVSAVHPGFDIFASMDPAKEVGGDFYDFFLVDENHLAVVMADVSGKGVPSALFMVIAKTLIKDLAQMGLSPDEVFRQANEKLCESNDEGMFVTAWLGLLDIHTGHMVYVNAGHNPPLIYRAGTGFAYLKQKPGFVLAGMEGMRYLCGELDLGEQDILYLYTDGVTEATGPGDELYGEERLLNVLNEAVSDMEVSLKQLLRLVKEDLQVFVKGVPQSDDITMLGLKILECGNRRMPEEDVQGPEEQQGSEDVLTMSAVLDNLDQVQEFVEMKLWKAGCPEKERIQVAMAVEEIFVNIVSYAYDSEPGEVEIRISISGNHCGISKSLQQVILEFRDIGKPFDPLEVRAADIGLNAEERKIGGLGIFMTRQLMDAVEYRYELGKNILTMKKSWE